MVKKKVVNKKGAKKSSSKKKVSKKKFVAKKSRSASAKRKTVPVSKINVKYRAKYALRDLILFGIMSLVSFLLYHVSEKEIYQDTFYLLTIVFLFVAIAFLIAFLALTFSRSKNKE